MQNSVFRIILLGMWPLGFLLLFVNLLYINVYIFGFLLSLGALATWATVTRQKWVRFTAAVVFLIIILFFEFIPELSSRHLVSHHPDRDKGFLEGVLAMLSVVQNCRPYIVVAALGLFSICIATISSERRN
jgi:hypothetical protein